MFQQLTVDWSRQRRDDFQAAMSDLIARSHAIDGEGAERHDDERVGDPPPR